MFFCKTLILLQYPNMKNFIIVTLITVLFASCGIFSKTKSANRQSKECTAINTSTVPDAVVQSYRKLSTANAGEQWFQLNKHTYAALQSKQLQLFKSNGKALPKVKIDTIPYGAYIVFSFKYPEIKYQRCFRINKNSFAVLFNKGGNNELAYYPSRLSVIDDEREYMEDSGIDMDNQDLWWDNDRIDEK
jgi:hypothetical protein